MVPAARTVVDETGRRVTIPDDPQSVISLAPSITETIYALGLDNRLVGDTDYCDYPPQAKQKPHVGAVLNPSLEKIVSLKPDLVFGIAEANRLGTADQLARLGIPLYGLTAHNLADTLRLVRDVGRVLNSGKRADELAATLGRRVEAVERRVAGKAKPKVLFVVWYRPLVTAGAHTFIADVIRHAGGISIADDLRGEWPHLDLEEVLRRDPDIILFPHAESFSPSLKDLRNLPGWRQLRAVKDKKMFFVSESIIHPSPRLIDSLEEVASILHPEGPRAAPGNLSELQGRPAAGFSVSSLDPQ